MNNIAPQVSLVAVGDELLNGKISDTNSAFIAGQLKSLGIAVRSIQLVGDSIEDICKALRRACAESSYVICTGGLGPTSDDRTREAISAVADCQLKEHPQSLAKLEDYCRKRNRILNVNNRRQVSFPETARVIPNPVGTADAFETPIRRCSPASAILALPGVPAEMRTLVEQFALERLKEIFPQRTSPLAYSFRIFGLAESQLGEMIDALRLPAHILVSYRPQFPELLLELAITDTTQHTLLTKACTQVRETLGTEMIISEAAGAPLPQVVAELLTTKHQTLACAESCSGGLLADALVSLPGASRYFISSIVAYSNTAKQTLLDVPETVLVEHGAVSKACALAMAEGARNRSAADYGLSITGVAGPDGGTKEKPVGTIWVALASAQESSAYLLQLPWNRAMLRRYACFFALGLLRKALLVDQQPQHTNH